MNIKSKLKKKIFKGDCDMMIDILKNKK
jgi:hypothetical protein